MMLIIIASAIVVLMVARTVTMVIYSRSPRRRIEARLTNFVGR
jgi:hypothetical protein